MDYHYHLLCSKCGKSLKNYQALISHEKWKHQQPKYHKCDVCTKNFRDSFTLKRHINGVHKNSDSGVSRTKTAVCPLCDFKGVHTYMSEHFSVQHNIQLKMESLIFHNMSDFNEWKVGVEQETMSCYVKHRASRKNKDGTMIHHFYCHRDGHFSSTGKKIRSLKILGSNKINAHCPSFMKVTENSRVTVEFSSTHVGHCGDIGRLTLSKAEKDKIASQVAMKVSLEDILNDIQNSTVNNEYNHLNLTNRKDLHNVIEQFHLNKDAIYFKRKNRSKREKQINETVNVTTEGHHEKEHFLMELTMPQNILELEQLKRIVKTIHNEHSLQTTRGLSESLEVIMSNSETQKEKTISQTLLESGIMKNIFTSEKIANNGISDILIDPSVEVIVDSNK